MRFSGGGAAGRRLTQKIHLYTTFSTKRLIFGSASFPFEISESKDVSRRPEPYLRISWIVTRGKESWSKSTEGEITEMFWFKSCPKCRGDLHRDSDAYGTFISCLQCGHYLTQLEEAQGPISQDSLVPGQVAPTVLEPVAA